MEEILVDKERSYQWLKYGDIKGGTRDILVEGQDQVITTNQFNRKILKEDIKSTCRLCTEYKETIDR
jgi:hypothetical protein